MGGAAGRDCGWPGSLQWSAVSRTPAASTQAAQSTGPAARPQPEPASLAPLTEGLEPEGAAAPPPREGPPPAQRRCFCLSPRIKGIQIILAQASVMGQGQSRHSRPRPSMQSIGLVPGAVGRPGRGSSRQQHPPERGASWTHGLSPSKAAPLSRTSIILASHNAMLSVRTGPRKTYRCVARVSACLGNPELVSDPVNSGSRTQQDSGTGWRQPP